MGGVHHHNDAIVRVRAGRHDQDGRNSQCQYVGRHAPKSQILMVSLLSSMTFCGFKSLRLQVESGIHVQGKSR